MNGYKSLFTAALTAVLNLVTAFGLDLTPEQIASILAVGNGVALPLLLIWIRFKTTGQTPAVKYLPDILANLLDVGVDKAKAKDGVLNRTPVWICVLLFPLMLLGGCSTLSGDPTTRAVTQLSFTYAVNYAIDEKGLDAQKIVDHINTVQDLLDGDASTTVDVLAQVLLDEIDFEGMEVNKIIFIRSLIPILAERAKAEIEQRGLLPEDSAVVVSEVLQWVEDAALMRLSI